ncbi:MAG: ADP-ribosylglycohydrolase family protein [Bacillota bacterium]|nr:ADP-ribosylglycohydrolase family protein [Bacillota bacterium]
MRRKARAIARVAQAHGLIYGLACGDALGATLEFMSRAEILARYGPLGHDQMTGGGPFGWLPGETTDDTAQALCVLEGALDALERDPRATPEAIRDAVGERLLAWFHAGPKDVGATTALALAERERLGSWDAASRAVARRLGERAAGNGALMRAAPLSLLWPDDPVRLAETSRAVAWMTHPHPDAVAPAVFLNLMLRRILLGEDARAAKKGAVADLAALAPDLAERSTVTVRRALRAGRLSEERMADVPGWAPATLEAALWAVVGARDAKEAVLRAIHLGGDADTVGAVAGALAGAAWGAGSLPGTWVGSILAQDELHHAFARWQEWAAARWGKEAILS